MRTNILLIFTCFLLLSDAARCAVPLSAHVIVVIEENAGFQAVYEKGEMPFLRTVAGANAAAVNYYANTHPSIGNYFMMTTGQIFTNDDLFSGIFSANNLIRQITAAGKTWKAYGEGLPAAGISGAVQSRAAIPTGRAPI